MTVAPAAQAGVLANLTVVKVVEGPVPAGTTFEIEVTCVSSVSAAADGVAAPSATTLTYGDAGGTDSLPVGPGDRCTVTETVDGGADSVSYACAVTDPGQQGDFVQCSADMQTVDYDVVFGPAGATVTVTNSFSEDPPTTTTTTTTTTTPGDPEPPVSGASPGVVAATPTFTG